MESIARSSINRHVEVVVAVVEVMVLAFSKATHSVTFKASSRIYLCSITNSFSLITLQLSVFQSEIYGWLPASCSLWPEWSKSQEDPFLYLVLCVLFKTALGS